MKETPISSSLLARFADATRYVVSGVTPATWFGPMQPLKPQAPEDVAGRRFDYPVGYNLNASARAGEKVTFDDLRALADSCDILRSVIETRKDQMEAQEWMVRVIPSRQKGNDQQRAVDEVTAFLSYPDGEHSFAQWMRQILEDLFVIDAVALYKRPNRAGKLAALEVMDGASIRLLLDEHGRTPQAPSPAYQQVLKGVPAVDYTREELLYLKHNPRSHKVYGYSHVEQVLVTVNILIRRALHQLEYFREGSQPDALIGLPRDWTQDQISTFQHQFDAMLAGNSATRRHVRFMPGEFKYQETKAPPLKDAYDEYLARIICFVFSVSPEPFVGQVNRATAQSAQERAIAEGLAPLQKTVRGLMNRIIQHELGYSDLEFVWQDTREQDPKEAAQIDVAYVNAGIITPDEVRQRMGLAALHGSNKPAAKMAQKYNPHHVPAGNPDGGQFTTPERAGGITAELISASEMDAENLPGLQPDSAAGEDGTDVAGDSSWACPEKLLEHFSRHAKDFSDITVEEYVNRASDFFKNAETQKLPMIEYGNGGEIGVYDPTTNTFGVYTQEGKVQSFYKPARPNYFQNQINRAIAGGGRIITPLEGSGAALMPEEVRNPVGAGRPQATLMDRPENTVHIRLDEEK